MFVCFFYYRSQWLPSIVWLPTFLKISSFEFNRRKKIIGLEQHEAE